MIKIGDFTHVYGVITAATYGFMTAKHLREQGEDGFREMFDERCYCWSDSRITLSVWDYLDGGLGSISVHLTPFVDDDGKLDIYYVVESELDGCCDDELYFDIGEEEALVKELEILIHTISEDWKEVEIYE